MVASAGGRSAIVQVLLSGGAHVNETNSVSFLSYSFKNKSLSLDLWSVVNMTY